MRRGFWHVALDKLGGASFAKHYRIATDPFAPGMILKVLHDRCERSRQVNVVAIYKTENFARGSFNTFVDGVNLAPILFAHPERESIFVAPDDIYSFIRTATVNNYVLEIRIILIEHRQDSLFEESSLIK